MFANHYSVQSASLVCIESQHRLPQPLNAVNSAVLDLSSLPAALRGFAAPIGAAAPGVPDCIVAVRLIPPPPLVSFVRDRKQFSHYYQGASPSLSLANCYVAQQPNQQAWRSLPFQASHLLK
jgi:hypothetical protein